MIQSPPTPIVFRKKRSFDQVLNTTFSFVKHNFKKLFQTFFTIGGPIILLTGVLYGIVVYGMASSFAGMTDSETAFDNLFGSIGMGFGAILLFVIVIGAGYILLTGAVYEFMALYHENHGAENITPRDVWTRLKNDLGRLFGSLIIVWGITFLGVAAFAGIIGGIAAISDSFSGGVVILVLLFPVLFAGLMFIIIRLMMVFPVVIFEKSGAWPALKRSFTLTAGAFWRTVGIVVIMSIIQSTISYIFLIPQLIIGIGLGLTTSSGEIDNSNILGIIMAVSYGIYFLVAFVLSSLTIIAIGIHYFSLVEEKDHSGLLERISEIGQSPSNLDSSLETY
ncbi:MAG: glycerophosphoryl diester phosphodiesterase membrane domain-containing protein [Bacteroidota bacterium]